MSNGTAATASRTRRARSSTSAWPPSVSSASAKADFDCSDPDHLCELGDFDWEGDALFRLEEKHYPNRDWTDVLKKAAARPGVRTLARRRNLLLLVGYHDDAVFDAS